MAILSWAAQAFGAPVVALESTLLAHGLPAPRNREVADALEATVRAHGAVPATVAVLDGAPRVGLTALELDRVCGGGLVKLSVRDLGVAVGLGFDGATTVAATAALAVPTCRWSASSGTSALTSWSARCNRATAASSSRTRRSPPPTGPARPRAATGC